MSIARVLCGVCGQRRVHMMTGFWYQEGPLALVLDDERGLVTVPAAGPLDCMPLCSSECGRWFEVIHGGTVRREDWWRKVTARKTRIERLEDDRVAAIATALLMADPTMGAEAALERAAGQMAGEARRAAA